MRVCLGQHPSVSAGALPQAPQLVFVNWLPNVFWGMLTRMAAPTTLSLSYPEADIAVITIGDPQTSANILSRHVLDALERHLDELDNLKALAGLVIRSG